MSDDPQNLGGVWYGRYDALGYADTNNFVARLDDDGGAISGTITEPDTSGGTGVRAGLCQRHSKRIGAPVRKAI